MRSAAKQSVWASAARKTEREGKEMALAIELPDTLTEQFRARQISETEIGKFHLSLKVDNSFQHKGTKGQRIKGETRG